MAFPNNLTAPAQPGKRLYDVDGNQYQVSAGSVAYFIYNGTNDPINNIRSILTGGTNNTAYVTDALVYYDGTKLTSNANLSFIGGILNYKNGNEGDGKFLVSDGFGNLDYTTINNTIPVLSTAQILALPTPQQGDLAYDSTKNALSDYDGVRWFTGRGAVVQKLAIEAGEVLEVNDGERVLTFGNVTLGGTINVTGTGEYYNISGTNRAITVFDDTLILSDTLVKVETDGRINTPILSETPGISNDSDFWFSNDAGVTRLNYKVGGVIKSVELT